MVSDLEHTFVLHCQRSGLGTAEETTNSERAEQLANQDPIFDTGIEDR